MGRFGHEISMYSGWVVIKTNNQVDSCLSTSLKCARRSHFCLLILFNIVWPLVCKTGKNLCKTIRPPPHHPQLILKQSQPIQIAQVCTRQTSQPYLYSIRVYSQKSIGAEVCTIIPVWVRPPVVSKWKCSLFLNSLVHFDPIVHNSTGNDQFTFHTYLLAPDTDLSTFTTGRVHYGQLIYLLTVKHTFDM